MKVAIPDDVASWQGELTEWQRDALVRAARGTYSADRGHDRLIVVRTNYGFDILGVRRVSCFDSTGAELTDAWALEWVDEVHPAAINHGDWERKYGRPRPRRRRAYDGMGEGHWGMKLRRRQRRYLKRARQKHARQQAWIRSELERTHRELAEWVGSPYTYPEYERIAELQSLLDEEVKPNEDRDGDAAVRGG